MQALLCSTRLEQSCMSRLRFVEEKRTVGAAGNHERAAQGGAIRTRPPFFAGLLHEIVADFRHAELCEGFYHCP